MPDVADLPAWELRTPAAGAGGPAAAQPLPPTLAWLHGLGHSRAYWVPVLPQLPEFEHLLLDLRGHGASLVRRPCAMHCALATCRALRPAAHLLRAQVWADGSGGVVSIAPARHLLQRCEPCARLPPTAGSA